MIIDNILKTIGKTPLVHLEQFEKKNGLSCQILAKVESFNPGGSTKDRVALNMIEEAEKAGLITPKTTIIEPTSGNTGVGLAMVCARKGYRLLLTMPESMSIERRKLLALLGAKIVLTPAAEGMKGAVDKATQLAKEFEAVFIPSQFSNPHNPEAHFKTTGPEIWESVEGDLDFLVAGVGTGGTLTGTAAFLKKEAAKIGKKIQIVAVEPASSALLSGEAAGSHRIQGIGANFIPPILDQSLIDIITPIKDEEAIEMAIEAAQIEGILCGISSGAALCAALKIASQPEHKGKRIVVIFPDTGERYLSSLEFPS